VALYNEHANRLFSQQKGYRVAYHGVEARQLHNYEMSTEHPRFRLRPSAWGSHGPGCYMTPSFSMAMRYAYSHWDGLPRFAIAPELGTTRYLWAECRYASYSMFKGSRHCMIVTPRRLLCIALY
jgi:hypothetical protein